MKGKKNILWLAAGLALMSATTTAAMAAPVAWTPTGGAFPGQYCYDFGGYIPSVDSPVLGGWGSFGGAVGPYGKLCANRPYGGDRDPYYYYSTGNSYFYRDTRAPSPNAYYAVSTYQDADGWTQYQSGMNLSCPRNSAEIRVPGYKRSDGGELTLVLNYYSYVGSAGATYAVSYPGAVAGSGGYVLTETSMNQVVCVKTDTNQ